MTNAKVLSQSPYGAFELKRSYQKNMFTGTLVSGSIPLLIIAVFFIIAFIQSLTGVPVVQPLKPEGKILRDIPPPRNFDIERTETSIDVKVKPPAIGVPNPVPDKLVMETKVVHSILEKVKIIHSDNPSGNHGGSGEPIYDLGAITGTLIPPPETFIARTEDPILIHAPVPAYPRLARAAGVEGMVIIQVYIDTEGNVVEARVAKPARSDVGFDQAALAAAWGRVYRPAMQNDQPVAVWMAYTVRFEISN